MRGALQQAQRLAIQNQFDVVVGFDLANARIRIAEDSTNDRRIGANERRRWVPLEPEVTFAPPPAAASPGDTSPGAAAPAPLPAPSTPAW